MMEPMVTVTYMTEGVNKSMVNELLGEWVNGIAMNDYAEIKSELSR